MVAPWFYVFMGMKFCVLSGVAWDLNLQPRGDIRGFRRVGLYKEDAL